MGETHLVCRAGREEGVVPIVPGTGAVAGVRFPSDRLYVPQCPGGCSLRVSTVAIAYGTSNCTLQGHRTTAYRNHMRGGHTQPTVYVIKGAHRAAGITHRARKAAAVRDASIRLRQARPRRRHTDPRQATRGARSVSSRYRLRRSPTPQEAVSTAVGARAGTRAGAVRDGGEGSVRGRTA